MRKGETNVYLPSFAEGGAKLHFWAGWGREADADAETDAEKEAVIEAEAEAEVEVEAEIEEARSQMVCRSTESVES